MHSTLGVLLVLIDLIILSYKTCKLLFGSAFTGDPNDDLQFKEKKIVVFVRSKKQ